MKKLITLLVLVWSISSCSKILPKQCWECTFGVVNGIQHAPVEICLDYGKEPETFIDINGDPLPSFCNKK